MKYIYTYRYTNYSAKYKYQSLPEFNIKIKCYLYTYLYMYSDITLLITVIQEEIVTKHLIMTAFLHIFVKSVI